MATWLSAVRIRGMMPGAAGSSLGAVLGQWGDLIRRARHWWLRELLALLPQNVAAWLVDNGSRSLVLATHADVVLLRLMTDGREVLASREVARQDYSPDLIDDFLRGHGQSRARVSIGLGLPEELIFRRGFVLPIETRRTLDAVVMQDLLTKTPFQLDDIHHAHRVRRVGDKLAVSQCVVRRAHVVAATEALGLDHGEIAFVELAGPGADDGLPAIITVQPSLHRRNPWAQWLALGLAATALLLALAVAGTRYHSQQLALDGLRVEVTAASAKAKSVLGMIEKLQQERAVLARLRGKRGAPGLLDVWEEASRILPAHTWLSELRLSGAQDQSQEQAHVVMTGFSGAAASLVAVLDQSQIFADAALVGPIAVDSTEGKERFIIQARLKPPGSTKTSSP